MRTRLALLLFLSGCGENEAVDHARVCAPLLPSSGWPTEAGVLQLDTAPAVGPFTPAPHRTAPPFAPPPAPVFVASPRIVTIVTDGDPLADELRAFADAVPSSAWWTAVTAEYGVGALRPGLQIVGTPMPGVMSGNDLRAYVRAAAAARGAEAAPDGGTVYLVFLAPGTEYLDSRNLQNCGCAELSGLHFALGDGTDSVALVQRCSAGDVDALTATASHEIVEATTDPTGHGFLEPRTDPPWQGVAWAGNELTDLCGGTRYHEGAWEYERSFSNIAAQHGDDPCVPAITEPYYNVTTSQDWYLVPSGGSVSIDLTGWSTAPRDDWFVYAQPILPSLGWDASVTSDESASAHGVTFHGINNGKHATLTVQAPTAKSGTSIVVHLYSRPSSPASDVLHVWPVGFHVP